MVAALGSRPRGRYHGPQELRSVERAWRRGVGREEAAALVDEAGGAVRQRVGQPLGEPALA